MTLKDTIANLRHCELTLGAALLQARLAGRSSLASKIRSAVKECMQLRTSIERGETELDRAIARADEQRRAIAECRPVKPLP